MRNSKLPAFPVVAFNEEGEMTTPEAYNGLSKREYFAALAMQGYCACMQSDRFNGVKDSDLAAWAVNMADALLAELDKKD